MQLSAVNSPASQSVSQPNRAQLAAPDQLCCCALSLGNRSASHRTAKANKHIGAFQSPTSSTCSNCTITIAACTPIATTVAAVSSYYILLSVLFNITIDASIGFDPLIILLIASAGFHRVSAAPTTNHGLTYDSAFVLSL